ncbi:hypothetical protein [Paraburkholderia sp. J11-2]|uniref:hypothetical protein n=1 Tax=Paraburkholderia sp. J11-2 TaxID=2805431 RepID=UPI002AB7252D|nr:hypothetical protein [Paraburkholderia sp. J11-2]
MKRSGFRPRRTPLKSSGFSRKSSPLADRKTAIRRSVKKATVADGAKYLAACRGEPCYLNACCPWTDWADPTVVPCHSNFAEHGKAGAMKAQHRFSVPGCFDCHRWLDQGKASYEVKYSTFADALSRWEPRRARKMGLTELEAA